MHDGRMDGITNIAASFGGNGPVSIPSFFSHLIFTFHSGNTGDDCSWSYDEWDEWTDFGTRSRSQTLSSPEGKCETVSVEESEVAVCRGSIISLQCDENQFVDVTAVNYGATNKCFYSCPDDQDCLQNALRDIQNDCNNRNKCELSDTDSIWDHFSSLSSTLSEDNAGRVFELELNLDVSYNCHDSYVHYPESGKS